MSNRVPKHLEPARTVLAILGKHDDPSSQCERADLTRGIDLASAITGRTPSTVYRWLYDKARGGTGGRVPQDDMHILLKWSGNNGVLRADHFFLPQSGIERERKRHREQGRRSTG